MKNNMTSQSEKEQFKNNDEIDFRIIFKFFFRNKKFISIISAAFLILSSIYSLTLRKVWRGNFQIVLETEDNTNQINTDFPYRNFFESSKDNDLETQVGILQSPSVLRPIYDFYVSNNGGISDKLDYSEWKKKKLNIELENRTSILNISYTDKNKGDIIPILGKISKAYQEYSGKNRKRSQILEKNFLEKQISLYKEKSSNSLKKAQSFAIDQNFFYFDSSSDDDTSAGSEGESFLRNVGVEYVRVQAANEIARIKLQLQKIEEFGLDSEKLQYFGSIIPALSEDGLIEDLSELDREITITKTKFQETDIAVSRLIARRKLIINLIRDRAIGYLNAELVEAEARMESAMRPKGVLLRYKELIREAGRDEATLVALENQYRLSELEAAKEKDPWALISKPTLQNNPVAPRKRIIAINGFIIGILISSLISLYKEKKSDKVFSINNLKKILFPDFIETITNKDLEEESDRIYLLSQLISNQSNNNLMLLSLGESTDEKIKKLKISLEKTLSKKMVNFNLIDSTSQLIKNYNDNLLLVFIDIKSAKISEINLLREAINILGINEYGIVILSNK
ncbi:MAG: hypothetical protein JJ837_08210 [Prochlorococcus marinus XMU1428]|nr:hypothetical protein [Prochlorococcus marinus XMU1428]